MGGTWGGVITIGHGRLAHSGAGVLWEIVREEVGQLSIGLRVSARNRSGRRAAVHPLAFPERVASNETAPSM